MNTDLMTFSLNHYAKQSSLGTGSGRNSVKKPLISAFALAEKYDYDQPSDI